MLSHFGGGEAPFRLLYSARESEFVSATELRVPSDGEDAVARDVVKRKRRNCTRRRELERSKV